MLIHENVEGSLMPNDLGGVGHSVHLLQSVASDFEALAALMDKTLVRMVGEDAEEMASLRRAREAAEKGAALASASLRGR